MEHAALLRQFFDLMLANGMCRADYWEVWSKEAQDNSDLWPLMREGRMIGGVFFKGQTVHIVIEPAWHGRWITKALRKAYDTWEHPGELLALMHRDNKKAITLATRLGFKFREDKGLYHLYVKEPA
jgi:GNAT superfamily N-acetyltransferase